MNSWLLERANAPNTTGVRWASLSRELLRTGMMSWILYDSVTHHVWFGKHSRIISHLLKCMLASTTSALSVKQHGYYGLDTGLGCLPCNCSTLGSTLHDCTEDGQCHCVPGVAGKRCDRCARGFYAFQDGGCTRKLLNPLLRCYCNPHTFLGALLWLLILLSLFTSSLLNTYDFIPFFCFPIVDTSISFGQVLVIVWA